MVPLSLLDRGHFPAPPPSLPNTVLALLQSVLTTWGSAAAAAAGFIGIIRLLSHAWQSKLAGWRKIEFKPELFVSIWRLPAEWRKLYCLEESGLL
jgi:hypothetical protein